MKPPVSAIAETRRLKSLYGLTAVPSSRRLKSQLKSISIAGYFAAAFSSKSTPIPGLSFKYA